MARTIRTSLLALLLLALAGACTGSGKNAPRAVDRTTLRVQNHSWLDMTIYVVGSSGSRQRLGLVNGSNTVTLTIPERFVGMGQSLRFLADPVGSSNVAQSFEIFVRPGAEVTLTIPPGVR